MASFETDLIKALEAEYFGPEFFKEQELIDKILNIRSFTCYKAKVQAVKVERTVRP